MIRKRMLLLSVFLILIVSVLNINAIGVSAVEYPGIYSSPAWVHTDDPASAIGTNYTFSVYTDYTGSDVWGYEFTLTFNPNILEGVEVVNGDLITSGVGPIMWSPGTFNNTSGELSLTGNGFFAMPPAIPPVTSGPGILANITFTVVAYGISNITLGDITRLIGYDAIIEEYNIVDDTMLGHIEGGIFYNTIKGDADNNGYVGSSDFSILAGAYGTSVGNPAYDERADFNHDGYIGSADFSMLAGNYGTSI